MAEIAKQSEALYERCYAKAGTSDERSKKTFTQDALLELCNSAPLNEVHNAIGLMPVVQKLANDRLFITLKSKTDGTCWELRARHVADKIKPLNDDEFRVYQAVEASHEKGVWIKNIKGQTGIKDQKALDRILNHLAKSNLVKSVKNAKANAQKTYMLFDLAPSDEITGGSFYDAGDLDENLVEELGNLIVFHIQQASWFIEKKKKVKRETSPILVRDDTEQTIANNQASHDRKKRKRESATRSRDIEDSAGPSRKHQRASKHEHGSEAPPAQLIYPAGHSYPTAESIRQWISDTNIIRAIKASSLSINEVQNVLNVLVWDGLLEEVNGGYRTVRGVRAKELGEKDKNKQVENKLPGGNALTEMPCGRCPVIDMCGDGGPINAANCVYFSRWLGKEVKEVKPVKAVKMVEPAKESKAREAKDKT